jgi:mono/diheme cytochrome c family protein
MKGSFMPRIRAVWLVAAALTGGLVVCGVSGAQAAGAPDPGAKDTGAQDLQGGKGGLLKDLWGITPTDRRNPAEYGEKLVDHLGCLYCHGLGGREGIMNPNAKDNKNVPSWDSPEFVKRYPTEEKVRETIQKGRHPDPALDATSTPIPMPPWGNRLSDQEVDGIVAYIWSLRDSPTSSHPEGGRGAEDAQSAYLPGIPPEMAPAPVEEDHEHRAPRTTDTALVRKGAALVNYLGCLHCHGVGGREGMDNPNAMRKHVPAWDDPEFIKKYPVDDGVRWVIEKGRVPERDPKADGTPVPMPPFAGQLTGDDLDALVAYIFSLREAPVTMHGHGAMHDMHAPSTSQATAEAPAAH